MEINIKKVNKTALIPTFDSANGPSCNLYACSSMPVVITPHNTVMVNTGIEVEIPEGYVGLIYARRGLADSKGTAPADKISVIDSNTKGEIVVALHNHSDKPALIQPNDRIAHLIIIPYLQYTFQEVD